ncbi:uncharacterized protein M6B38_140150 [Iris pallida]|uniref:Uncharacterized protein n=1 Tax=Iris pallida TaxID=29817 RepID=A0AAX6FD71_IRIPA|nr:uncharacterized protein M6B38_140150 [Iris pallida]
MKTMAMVAHRRSQCYGQSKPRLFGRFGSCRSFEPGAGILPSPPLASPVFQHSPRSDPCFRPEPRRSGKQGKLIAVAPKPSKKRPSSSGEETWAGPTCSSSPPPSSVPIPKFSLLRKRSVSLELPPPSDGIEIRPLVMSAPTSPTRDAFSSATENLRRILHLDSC